MNSSKNPAPVFLQRTGFFLKMQDAPDCCESYDTFTPLIALYFP